MEKISSDLKLSALKHNSLSKAYERLHAQWRDLEEHFDLTRKSIESEFEELEQRAKEVALKEQRYDRMQEHLREFERELAAKESELGSVLEKLRLKEEHLDSIRKSVEECSGDLELKKQELQSMQISVEKCFSEIESKNNQLGSLKLSLVQCSKKLRWKEQRLEVVEKSIHKCFDEVMLKGKELESTEKKLEDCLGKLELKEKELCEVQKLIKEQSVELEMKERQIDTIKILIQENSEELELKVKQCDETEKSIIERKMELKLKEKEVESVDKSIKKQLEEVKSREKIMDLRERKIKDFTDELESKVKKLDVDVELNEREYNAIGRSIEERKQELELKENQLKSAQNFIEEFDKKLKSKEEMLNLIQKAIVECSREKELKQKQLSYVQDLAKERLKELELEEKNLFSFKKSIEECSHDLEMRKRQIEKRARELDVKEKRLDTLQNSINEALKGKKCHLPSQVNTEQLEYAIANNAIATVPYPAPFRPCAHGQSLQLLMNTNLHRHELVCRQVSTILQTSSDPSKLVLDAMQGFYPPHSGEGCMEFDVNIIRRSCIFLLEQLMKASSLVNPQVREAAMKLAVEWKEKMRMASDNCFEVLGFLQLLAAYGLGSCFDGYELQSLLDMVDQHRHGQQALELRQTLGITCKAPVTSILHSQEQHEYLSPENAVNYCSSDLQPTATTCKNFQLLLNEQWNSPHEMCNAIFHALQMSLDPAKLVLDVIQGSFPRIWERRQTSFQASAMNSYFFMLEQLMRMAAHIDPQVKEEAIKLAVEWKERLTASTSNSLEVLGFLQLLASYGLASSFDGYEILKLFEVITQYKQAVELCHTLGFADEIPDYIEKLIERKMYIKAVSFVCAFKLVDKFPPVFLLKEYLENVRTPARKVCQKKKSFQVNDEATDAEIDALRTVKKCIIDFNLEPQFPPKDIEKRIVELEKQRAERRRSVPGSKKRKKRVRHQNKNKRLRTDASTVEQPFDIPAFTLPWQYETSYPSSGGGGPQQFGLSGDSSNGNFRGRLGGFAGNRYLYHS